MRGERALIERIRERLGPAPSWVRIGIGDDAAVIEPERNALEVLTTDTLVEGVHWDPRFCSPADVGHKSLAVNLSDLAAMGASPRAALLSLSVSPRWAEEAADAFLETFATLARQQGIAVVGGNVTASPGPAMVGVTATGSVRPRRVLTRKGARAGDDLYVTGSVGAALAGLLWLEQHPTLDTPSDPELAACVLRYRRPSARIRTGLLLGRNRIASACIDLSDGLADGVRQIAEGSGTGARVEGGLLPIDSGTRAALETLGQDPVAAAVRGGDDYELLFAVSPRRRRALEAVRGLTQGAEITRIGALTAGHGLVLVRDGREEALPEGFVHF